MLMGAHLVQVQLYLLMQNQISPLPIPQYVLETLRVFLMQVQDLQPMLGALTAQVQHKLLQEQ